MSKQILRWVTIILPVFLLSAILIITDLIVVGEVHLLQIIIMVVIIALGSVVFSNWVFSQLEEREIEIRKRAAQLEALNLSGLSLITELDLGVVLQKVVDLSRELVSARYGALGVLNDQETGFQQFITSGLPEEERAAIGAPPQGRGLFRYLIEEGKPLIVDEISQHEHSFGFPENHPVMRSMIAVPIKNKGKVIGNLYLTEKMDPWNPESRKPMQFDNEDLRVLELFATQSAIAVENARLYRQVQQLAVLEERQRFGMDLHDGVIQSIYAVGLMLESIEHQVDHRPEAAKQGIDDAIKSLNTAIRDIRNYILDLRPQHFQGRNIVQGVEELARALRANTFMDVYVEITDVDSGAIGPEQTVEVLHIAQEALQNIQKHAQASEVSIALRTQNGALMLDILDNGVAIKPQDLQRSLGNGLVNMQERASSLDGEINIGPKLEGGTEVRLTIPLDTE